MVALKLKATTTSQDGDALIEAIRRLPERVPGILELRCGRNVSPARAHGYEIGVFVRFPGREELQAYGPHPEHQAVSRHIQELCADVLALDFEV